MTDKHTIRHGDGGGGPTPEMLERLERMKDVVYTKI